MSEQTTDSTAMMASLAQVKALVSLLERDVGNLSTGRKNAAPSARKQASCISKECAKLRQGVLAFQKSIPVKKRAPKEAPAIDVEQETKEAVTEIGKIDVPQIDDIKEPVPPPPKLTRQQRGRNVPKKKP